MTWLLADTHLLLQAFALSMMKSLDIHVLLDDNKPNALLLPIGYASTLACARSRTQDIVSFIRNPLNVYCQNCDSDNTARRGFMSGEETQEALVDYDEDVDVEKEEAGETDKLAKVKGRGHREGRRDDRDRGGVFEDVEDDGAGGSGGPAKSVEGWVIMVTGVHEEAQEDEVLDKFSEYGKIKDIQINLDRRTGFVKGYALIEFEKFDEAQAAIKEMDGQELYEKPVKVDWAFVKGSQSGGNVRRRGR